MKILNFLLEVMFLGLVYLFTGMQFLFIGKRAIRCLQQLLLARSMTYGKTKG